MARMTNFRSAAIATGNAINGSAYDNVKIVADSIADIGVVSNVITNDGVNFKLLSEVLSTLGNATSQYLAELSGIDLGELVNDLAKGNYLGNRKLDINLALNVVGITQGLIKTDPQAAKNIWVAKGSDVTYDSATITFIDGTVTELPFLSDGVPTVVTNSDGLLVQFTRNDSVAAVAKEYLIYGINVYDSTTYTVTIDNTAFTYSTTIGATRGEIVTGLTNQINGGVGAWTAYAEVDNIRIKADVAGNDFLTTVDINLTIRVDIANITAGNYPTTFLDTLLDTSFNSFTLDSVVNTIRFYDVIGQNSNIERIQLHSAATASNYVDKNPIYYWGATTSSLETLAMRAGDIIKLGSEIDKIILLADSISQVLEIQNRIPELIDTYIGGAPQGDVTIYNKLDELHAIYTDLTNLMDIYQDIRAGGNNYTNTVAANLIGVNTIGTVASDIASVIDVHNNMAAVLLAPTKAAEAVAARDEIINITGNQVVQTLASGSTSTAYYNSTTGKFTFGIPQGAKGDKGDSFQVNAIGPVTNKGLYDAQVQGFSFLALDESKIYFKQSATSGDWSIGSPFGKGATGNGIATVAYTSSTGTAQGQAGETDTYTITYTDTTVDTFIVKNGIVPTKIDLGLGNVDNTADIDKPISTAVQTALNNIITSTTAPTLASTTVSLNERTTSSISITNYEAGLTYTTSSSSTLLGTAEVVNGNLVITAGDITNGLDSQITIGVQAKTDGIPVSNVTNVTVNVIYIPTSADTTIQVVNIFSDLQTNTGFIGV